jgi:hypothetical protein
VSVSLSQAVVGSVGVAGSYAARTYKVFEKKPEPYAFLASTLNL